MLENILLCVFLDSHEGMQGLLTQALCMCVCVCMCSSLVMGSEPRHCVPHGGWSLSTY